MPDPKRISKTPMRASDYCSTSALHFIAKEPLLIAIFPTGCSCYFFTYTRFV